MTFFSYRASAQSLAGQVTCSPQEPKDGGEVTLAQSNRNPCSHFHCAILWDAELV